MLEDVKAFFSQCAKPFIHSWKSIREAQANLMKYLQEFKEWYNDPVRVSTRRILEKSSEVSVHYSLASGEDQASLELQYEHSTPQLAPLSVSITLPPHVFESSTGSYQSNIKLTTRSHSPSIKLQSSPLPTPWSSETRIAPYGARLNPGDAGIHLRPLRPSYRSQSSSDDLISNAESADPLIVPKEHSEANIPPQAAWAPTVLQPQRYQGASR